MTKDTVQKAQREAQAENVSAMHITNRGITTKMYEEQSNKT